MPEFFKPRRRKIGLVSLLLACVCLAGWVRSRGTFDSVSLNREPFQFLLISADGRLHFLRTGHLKWSPFYRSSTMDLKWVVGARFNQGFGQGAATYDPTGGTNHRVEWRKDWGVCRGSIFSSDWDFQVSVFGSTGPQRRVEYFAISYGVVVIPLTVISLWLLLSTSRQAHPATALLAEPKLASFFNSR